MEKKEVLPGERFGRLTIIKEVGTIIRKPRLCAEIERQWKEYHEKEFSEYNEGAQDALDHLLSFLDTIEVKPVDLEKEINEWMQNNSDDNGFFNQIDLARHFYELGRGASEIPNNLPGGLDEAAEGIVCTMINECSAVGIPNDHIPSWVQDAMIAACKAGAKWREEQFEKNRLAACENQTKEEYDRETDFAIEIINKEHRQPTFSDAINYGMRLQKEQMMREEVEGIVEKAPSGKAISVKHENGGHYWAFGNEVAKQFNLGDKVRIIIVKED